MEIRLRIQLCSILCVPHLKKINYLILFIFTEHPPIQPPPFGYDPDSKKDSHCLLSNLLSEQNNNSASLRNQERLDSSSSSEDHWTFDQNQLTSGQNQLTSGQNQLTSGQNQLTSYPPTAQNKLDSQFRPPQPASATICAAGGATALLSPLPVKNNSSNHNSEKEAQIGEKRPNCSQQGNLDLAWLAENPAFLAACYCLALLHQLGGLDFLSLLGMVLAMTSMVSMFFL